MCWSATDLAQDDARQQAADLNVTFNQYGQRDEADRRAGRRSGALVRCDAYPPDWSRREGPSEYAHWLLHTEQSGPYQLAGGPDGRVLVWTGESDPWGSCPGPFGWHVSKAKPDRRVQHMRGMSGHTRSGLKRSAKRCTVDLGELEQTWHAKAEAELAELLQAQARYDAFKALPLIPLPD
jgi:hypothetical protein